MMQNNYPTKPIFTEEEKNEIITFCAEELECYGEINCPFATIREVGCKESICIAIFPSVEKRRGHRKAYCPCYYLTKKYVIPKFWKALE